MGSLPFSFSPRLAGEENRGHRRRAFSLLGTRGQEPTPSDSFPFAAFFSHMLVDVSFYLLPSVAEDASARELLDFPFFLPMLEEIAHIPFFPSPFSLANTKDPQDGSLFLAYSSARCHKSRVYVFPKQSEIGLQQATIFSMLSPPF